MKSLLGTVRKSDVIFRASGLFDLTARVVRALGISPGDVVDVLSDDSEYYLYVACHHADNGRYEAQVFPSKRKSSCKHYRGSSSRLCKAMLSVSHAKEKAALPCGPVMIDSQGRRLLPIIVRLNLAEK